MSFRKIKLPSDKSFGYFFSIIFLFVTIYFIYHENYGIYLYFTGFLFLFFFSLSLLKPQFLRPINKLWMFLGYVLSKIFTPVIFSIIFYFLITPIALLQKLFKGSELKIKFSKNPSYWFSRKKNVSEKIDFNNQY